MYGQIVKPLTKVKIHPGSSFLCESGLYSEIRTAQGANQNAPFQCRPLQLYNKWCSWIGKTLYSHNTSLHPGVQIGIGKLSQKPGEMFVGNLWWNYYLSLSETGALSIYVEKPVTIFRQMEQCVWKKTVVLLLRCGIKWNGSFHW